MGRKSSISRLPPEIREAIDRAIRDGRATAAEIVALVDQLGGQVSESAVTRYARSAREQMATYRQAQEIASVWAKRMEEQPQGDVAQLNLQLLSTLAFKVLSDISERPDGSASPGELQMLGKALNSVASAERMNLERELRIRKEVAQAAAARAVSAAKKGGLSAEAADAIRRDILGLAA